jgi:hypothetical protein
MGEQNPSNLPPWWAEALLRALLPARDRETVPGDLLEEYRESVALLRGRLIANRWYVRQVASVIVRRQTMWAVLFSITLVARVAVDAFVPTDNFSTRAVFTTYVTVNIWLSAGFACGWRTASLKGSVVGGGLTAVLACLLVYAGTAAILGVIMVSGNDAAWASIQRSGGAAEMILLPVMTVIPATVLATIGGAAALLTRRVLRIAGN